MITWLLAAIGVLRRDTKLEEQVLTVLLRYGEIPGKTIYDCLKTDFNRRLLSMVSIYPVLHRLETDGFIASRWGEEAVPERAGARRRYYKLTGKRKAKGKILLVIEDDLLESEDTTLALFLNFLVLNAKRNPSKLVPFTKEMDEELERLLEGVES